MWTFPTAGSLPGPQAAALGTALGMSTGAAPDRFLVSLAVLGLLSEVAEGRPVLGVMDEARWLDQAWPAHSQSGRSGVACADRGLDSRTD